MMMLLCLFAFMEPMLMIPVGVAAGSEELSNRLLLPTCLRFVLDTHYSSHLSNLFTMDRSTGNVDGMIASYEENCSNYIIKPRRGYGCV